MPKPPIEPKPTQYRNILFRSRLEARWAVVFDNVPNVLNWQYEPTTFKLRNGWTYTPDFRLHLYVDGEANDMYVEIKPAEISAEYDRVLYRFTQEKKISLLCCVGSLWQDETIHLSCYHGGQPRRDVANPKGLFTNIEEALSRASTFRFDLKDD